MVAVRVADLIADLLVEHGIRHAFMLTGGGAMHLNDALGRAAGLQKVFTHHEQAAAIAAESYARLGGVPAVVNVTTGPGGVNALNGVYGAYVDSIPMVIVSGQVKRETYAPNFPLPLRQLGDQEVDIVSMVAGITKFATVLQDPKDTLKVVQKALHLAVRGRPGPVWIDVPIDVQGSLVDREELEPYDPSAKPNRMGEADNTAAEEQALTGAELTSELAAMLAELCAAERPLVLSGAGIRLSGMHRQFLALVERLGVPVVTGWNAHDVIPNDHPLFVGRPGTVGDRGGNFAVQTADYLLVLGSRLNIRQVSYNWQSFAKNARVAMIDIDRAELGKPTLRLHRPIHADLREALPVLLSLPLPTIDRSDDRKVFLARSRQLAESYPTVEKRYWEKDSPINPYCFGEALFDALEEGDIVVTADGTACVTIFQAARLKFGQRLYTNSGCASMGYDLPAAIGAAHAAPGKRIICLAGDGSIMMNLQELQTIAGGNLPIKVFLLNNDGYHSIRQTQQNYFSDNIVGCGPDSGLTFPDFQRLADAFGLPSNRAEDHVNLRETISMALDVDGPFFCEIMLDKAQEFAPKLASRRLPDGRMVSPELEDMAPFLPREELALAMNLVQERAE
jgi:acetolactate synthase-1/2/3 large subunit